MQRLFRCVLNKNLEKNRNLLENYAVVTKAHPPAEGIQIGNKGNLGVNNLPLEAGKKIAEWFSNIMKCMQPTNITQVSVFAPKKLRLTLGNCPEMC